MRVPITVLALALLPMTLAAQSTPIQPNCSARSQGDRLVTTMEYPNGYIAEAPWRVANTRTDVLDGKSTMTVAAVLDRVIEYNPQNGERVATPFPALIEIIFEAEDQDGILEVAAKVWCSTVARVKSGEQDSKKPIVSLRAT
jgi:hypothetical protein